MNLSRINPYATRSDHTRMAVIDAALLDAVAAGAASNPRGREIHILHTGDDDTPQRMLNAVEPHSYLRPHRHAAPPKAESFLILRGRAGILTFADDGPLEQAVLLCAQAGTLGVDIRAGVYHALVGLVPGTVLFEVKPGPYSTVDDKDMAPWAPAPDAPEATAYLQWMAAHFAAT